MSWKNSKVIGKGNNLSIGRKYFCPTRNVEKNNFHEKNLKKFPISKILI
jgi:hypothetical protein